MVREGQCVAYRKKLGELDLFRCKRRCGEILMLSGKAQTRWSQIFLGDAL